MRYPTIAFLLAACTLPQPASAEPATHAAPQPAIVREAEAFMAAYAKELAAGDRAALPARYSRDGARTLGFGPATLETQAQLTATYAGPDWQPPRSFAWRDLAYEPLGRDAVVVVGGFDWDTGNGKPPIRFAYTALLRRENESLRIRVEHENPLRPPAANPPAR